MNKSLAENAGLVIGAAVALVGLYLFAKREVGAGAAAVGRAFDPTSSDNLAARGVNAVGAALSGDASWSLGAWFYDVTHDDGQLATPPSSTYPNPGGSRGWNHAGESTLGRESEVLNVFKDWWKGFVP